MKKTIFIIYLASLFSCGQSDQKKENFQKLTNQQISQRYTAKELYYTLLKRYFSEKKDTLPLKKLYTIYSKKEIEYLDTTIVPLKRVPSDSLVDIYVRKVSKGIYGRDNRIDVIQEQDITLQNDSKSVVALIHRQFLTPINDSTYFLKTKGKYGIIEGLCNSNEYKERFFDQDVVADCSGFACSNNAIITAGHCVDEINFKDFVFVFNYQVDSQSNLITIIKASDIYIPIKIQNTPRDDNNDFRIITVDRPIRNERIAKIRMMGKITNDQLLYVIGTPKGLPLKISDSARIFYNENKSYFTINSDTYKGNSGSPVFNRKTHVVEGILVRGDNDFEFVTMGNNCKRSIRCPEFGCYGEDVIRSTQFSQFIHN